jgi:4-nitrophenyl phosphatase
MPGSGLLLLVDLDGVLYRGAEPVLGVAAVLATRAAQGDDVVYVTNNSMWYRAEYVDRIAAMGAPVSADRIVSSPRATALYLRDHEPGIRHVLTVGASGMDRELEDAGFRVTRAGDIGERIRGSGIEGTDGANGWEAAGRPDAVVVGLDPKIDYLRLAVANDCVRAGARFIATNRDPVYPTERAVRPGAGSIVAAVEAASGVTPISIGKPEPYLLEEAARAVGRDAHEAVMIGDGLGTDIAAAIAVGARSILMLTGVTTRAEVDALPADQQPTAIAADAAELAAALERLAA